MITCMHAKIYLIPSNRAQLARLEILDHKAGMVQRD